MVDASLTTLGEALRMFPPEEIALSFNGGKDCTVALHLLTAAISKIEE